MSVNLSIKNASDEVVAALKSRARRNHRSLQGELMAIIEAAAAVRPAEPEARGLREIASEWRVKDHGAITERPTERAANRADDATSEARERDIRHLMGLLKKGLPLGGRRFTRDEMHER